MLLKEIRSALYGRQPSELGEHILGRAPDPGSHSWSGRQTPEATSGPEVRSWTEHARTPEVTSGPEVRSWTEHQSRQHRTTLGAQSSESKGSQPEGHPDGCLFRTPVKSTVNSGPQTERNFRTVRSQIFTRDCDGVGMMNEAEHDQSVLGNLGDWEGPEFLGIGLVWLIIAPLIALLRTRQRPWRDVEEGPSQRRSGV